MGSKRGCDELFSSIHLLAPSRRHGGFREEGMQPRSLSINCAMEHMRLIYLTGDDAERRNTNGNALDEAGIKAARGRRQAYQ